MVLSTIQNYKAYQRMLETGKLVSDEEYVMDLENKTRSVKNGKVYSYIIFFKDNRKI